MHTDWKLSTEPDESANSSINDMVYLLCTLKRKIIQSLNSRTKKNAVMQAGVEWSRPTNCSPYDFSLFWLPTSTYQSSRSSSLLLPFSLSRTSDAQIAIISIAVNTGYQSTSALPPASGKPDRGEISLHIFWGHLATFHLTTACLDLDVWVISCLTL